MSTSFRVVHYPETKCITATRRNKNWFGDKIALSKLLIYLDIFIMLATLSLIIISHKPQGNMQLKQ